MCNQNSSELCPICDLHRDDKVVIPKLGVSPHSDYFTRLSVTVTAGECESIDFVAPDGTLLARVNAFNHGGVPSFDIIFSPGKLSNVDAFAMFNGARVAAFTATAVVVSVSEVKR